MALQAMGSLMATRGLPNAFAAGLRLPGATAAGRTPAAVTVKGTAKKGTRMSMRKRGSR